MNKEETYHSEYTNKIKFLGTRPGKENDKVFSDDPILRGQIYQEIDKGGDLLSIGNQFNISGRFFNYEILRMEFLLENLNESSLETELILSQLEKEIHCLTANNELFSVFFGVIELWVCKNNDLRLTK